MNRVSLALFLSDPRIFRERPSKEVFPSSCSELCYNGRTNIHYKMGRRVFLRVCLAVCPCCVARELIHQITNTSCSVATNLLI